ncbi:M23 family peptidase [Desulfonema ishimotonii]|uniref:M23 family peptidase n=1 Tax=Desulfonema ishimotonii TaxID=45657 RepID=A0A401FXL6_9BACT|nr:M23 family metallopeptidase [Desulfonema ishimotonii]GBC61673.1 M23 family peptidase [Desulfonema ishimotonii]
MSDPITLMILSPYGAPVKQIMLSKKIFWFTGFLFIAVLTGLGFGAYDYYQLRQTAFDTRELEGTITSHQEIVLIQRRQIQKFAGEINLLKSKLMALNGFEKQIRVIANLDHPDAQNGLFGVGGSIPEDLDPKLSLKEKHNSLIREMHGQIDQLEQASENQEAYFETLLKELDGQKTLLACTPAIRPTKGVITSAFGSRNSPFTNLKEFHKGLDIAARKGTPVYVTANGKVTFAGVKGAFGKLIVVDHGHGLVTRYAHLSKILKKTGDRVKRSEKIGLMGNTGRSTGPHLHYEVRLNGMPVNPKKYILN